ncbi:guanylate kinase [Croceimicrobium hydrocarbonivorans]|uniref:Guanylate kinase n=1 Tax=Croceimicrobium hydrocarbonivorans TaxID=2761580 RepID=A0A7H0VIY4_9FLAO|nr:guanylate kinase [Croceimicrobium hydrocarbonivorans]QNR25682.1 guanylate kinase [Croceimicrobium hydrocarbonivorans]
MSRKNKMIIFSAPSGAGKTTLVRHLLQQPELELAFSISATSRAARGKEQHGKDYYFLSNDEFNKKVEDGAFLEWEEVYAGTKYGTLRSEIDRLWKEGKNVIFDIDVVGGLNLKSLYGDQALAIFVMPPNEEELERRLRSRDTDSDDKIRQRMAKARKEIGRSDRFDHILLNKDLDTAKTEAYQLVKLFLGK